MDLVDLELASALVFLLDFDLVVLGEKIGFLFLDLLCLKSAFGGRVFCSSLKSLLDNGTSSETLHCKPLQGNYRVELVHREIPVVITGNEFTEYSFLLFWLHFFPCFNNIEIVALVPVICTGNCQFILQGFKGCFNTL